MGGRWNLFGFQLHKVLCIVLMFHLQSDECLSLNLEGLALLEFRSRVEIDPYGVLDNWDPNDKDPCNWSGVCCVDGKVEILNLKELSLGGMLASDLGKLSHLRALMLYKNNFSGVIPKEIGGLTMLELLDLRDNNLSGTIPIEIGEMLSLKRLLLCGNRFQGVIPSWIEKHNMLSELQFDQNLSIAVVSEIGCTNRKVGHCIWRSGLQQLKKANSFLIPLKVKLLLLFDMLPSFKFKTSSSHDHEEKHGGNLQSFTELYVVQNVPLVHSFRRRLLQVTSNLPATPVNGSPSQEVVNVPSTGSGSFPAVPISNNGTDKKKHSPAPTIPPSPPTHTVPVAAKSSNESASSKRLGWWIYVLVLLGAAFLVIIAASMFLMCRRHGVATIRPWKTGLSGQLQKAFITGVPKLNRTELEAACEDFSNIISTSPDCTVFKGTLSNGVEIAVASTAVGSVKDWSKRSEMRFRKKIDTLSRVNHKNFVNLLGYCEENEPFMRMMVFEYAPNGTLFEHLHVKEFEHLDWSVRMRTIMGMAYCLQYMHHDLNPPVAHPDLLSSSIFMTEDYASKIVDISIWKEVFAKGKLSGDDDMDLSESPTDIGSNVYSFGLLLLEIISGKVPYSEEHGSLVNWAVENFNDKRNIRSMIDPSLKAVKNNELDIVSEVIQECLQYDAKKRPTMKEITTKLREVIPIAPEAATPKLSPLWWAELEILSVEAS